MCVISDRWYALTLGLPFMIEVTDCDVRLPGPDLRTLEKKTHWSPDERSSAYITQIVNLSLLLGKVTRTIYRLALFV